MMGWKAVGTFDYPNKCIIIAAPHTSNWDFFFGKCYGYISGVRPNYLIKSSFFIPVIGTLFRWSGGIPVYRNTSNNLVDQIVSIFNNSDVFRLGIAPEGTRKRVSKWKTGFYYIAHKARVPIVMVALDFKHKKIGVVDSLIPTGDINKDMLIIQNYFKDSKGKKPENYNPIIR